MKKYQLVEREGPPQSYYNLNKETGDGFTAVLLLGSESNRIRTGL